MKDAFLTLLQLGIGAIIAPNDKCLTLLDLSMQQWRDVMALAERQGVAAIAFDGVQKLHDAYGKRIKAAGGTPVEWMQWVFECTGMMTLYEQRSQQQQKVIEELAEIWGHEGIQMMVFKGQANAPFYPVPNHRATGDIDCWLFGEAEKGDEIAKAHGADVSFDWYRHSKIAYSGETIENHRVMSHTHGSKKKQEMERELQLMLQSERLMFIDGCGKAMMPSPQFNACFLTYHGLHHFLTEGLRMKQILDWAVFLQNEQNKVDWYQYNDFCKRYKLDRFAEVMNYIATEYLGVQIKVPDIHVDGNCAEKIIQSTLYDDDYLFNSGKGDWTVRWLLVKNMLGRDKWKYRDIAQQNVWTQLWRSSMGFLIRRDDE